MNQIFILHNYICCFCVLILLLLLECNCPDITVLVDWAQSTNLLECNTAVKIFQECYVAFDSQNFRDPLFTLLTLQRLLFHFPTACCLRRQSKFFAHVNEFLCCPPV